MREHRGRVYFATGNKSKFLEARQVASSYGMKLQPLFVEKREIQANDIGAIARHAVSGVVGKKHPEVIAEDSGFFVEALGGFPGPYSSYVFKTIGPEGILQLLQNARGRAASFKAAVAYCKKGEAPVCFFGTVKGDVSRVAKGLHGFGFDPIFVPKDSDARTFAQMTTLEKNQISHRAKAFRRFCSWYTRQ